MKDFEIYSKTLTFSLRRLGLSFLGLAALIGLPVGAFLLTMNLGDMVCLVATLIGLVIGIAAMWALGHFLGYLMEAAQVAMITKAVTEDELPEDVYTSGKEVVKSRFATVAAYYAIYGALQAITSQITNAVDTLAEKIGDSSKNDAVKGIGAVISLVVAIVLSYVNYCCLGWVFYRKEESALKATLDGAVMYFQNWKTLLKNTGRVLLILVICLALIGAPLYFASSAITSNLSGLNLLLAEIAESISDTEHAIDAQTLSIIMNGILALIVFAVLYETLVAPYVLVGFLRRYMAAAQTCPPAIDLYEKICGISKRFRKEFEKLKPAESAV